MQYIDPQKKNVSQMTLDTIKISVVIVKVTKDVRFFWDLCDLHARNLFAVVAVKLQRGKRAAIFHRIRQIFRLGSGF